MGPFSAAPGGGTGGGPGGGNGGGGGSGAVNEPLVINAADANAGYGKAVMAGNGSRVVFTGDSDTLGTNPAGEWQLWSVDLNTGDLLQLTTGDDNPVSSFTEFDVSDDGSQVVWVSNNDFTGQNPNNRSSVFLAETDGSGITQVTINIETFLLEPIISGNGSRVAFLSDSDLTGDNPGLDRQIFTIDSNGNNLAQVTDLPAALVRDIAFSDDGSTIAWVGSGDPFGTNTDNSLEIFAIGLDGTNFRQVTSSEEDVTGPKLSDNGSVVVFASQGDHSPGANSDGSYEIFAAQTDGSGVIQVSNHTADTGTTTLTTESYNISGDGSTVIFSSRSDLVGLNPQLEETIYWAVTTGGAPVQLLRSGTIADASQRPIGRGADLSNDGSQISFYSPRNFTSFTQPQFDLLYTINRQ